MHTLRRKMGLLKTDQGGQSLVFVAMSLFMMFLFVCVTVDVGDFVAQKIDAQNDADAMAVSTAVWQARGLNVIQTLNVAKNVAHMHYLFELAEVFYWAGRVAANVYDFTAWWYFFQAAGDPVLCWVLDACPDESLPTEKEELEEELGTLTLIQHYIAGTGSYAGSTLGGSVEQHIKLAIPIVDRANNKDQIDGVTVGVNMAVAQGLFGDQALRIEMRPRDAFAVGVLEEIGLSDEITDFLGDALAQIFDIFEVDFDWAVQSSSYIDEQFTVGFAVRAIKPAPLFGSRFQAQTLISSLFGGLIPGLGDGRVQLAIAQAKPFKPDPYTLDPGSSTNGMAANVFGLPFNIFAYNSEGNNQALWDVKLTPVTVLDTLGPISTLMTH